MINVLTSNSFAIPAFARPKVHHLFAERTPVGACAAIAIVDDDDLVRESLAGLLRSFDIRAEAFPSAASFLSANPGRFDVVLSDLQMPGMSGADLWRVLNEQAIPLPMIIITAFPERAADLSPSHAGLHVLEKPIDSARLISCIEMVLGRHIP